MSAEKDFESGVRRSEAAQALERDLTGKFFFWLHFVVVIYVVIGWIAPSRGALIFYEAFLPAVAVQWWFNQNSCVLNNIESKIRTGSWRNPDNPEEGAWLLQLVRSWLGINATPAQMDAFIYTLLLLLWSTGLWRLWTWHSAS